MRILLASYFYPPSVGGVERQSHLLARGLVARGHSVRVVCARLGGGPAREVLDGVFIVRVHPGHGSRWQKMTTFLGGMLAASGPLFPSAEVVQVQQLLYPAVTMALIQPAFGWPLVVRNSGSGTFGGVRLMQSLPLGAFGLSVVARRATGVSLNVEMTREMNEVGFRRLVEIPNGVEVPAQITSAARAAARAQLGVAGPMVLYAGRLEDEKGVDVLVQAWGHARVKDAMLLIVGDGSRSTELQTLAGTLGISSSVRFHEPVTSLSPYFAAADLFVLASRSEGLSNALLEAMATGVPVIATDVGGNRQIVADATLGCLVPSESPESLAVAIKGMLGDPVTRDRYAQAARAHVERHYSASAMVERFECLYDHLVRPRAGRLPS